MSSNGVIRRLRQKEVRLFFASPVAWLFLATFAAVTLFVFFWVETFFARNIADIRPLFEWMPILLIFLCAAITMRMWSEERRSGTLEQLLSQPVSLWRLVLGKFSACFVLLLLALLATAPLPITVALIADLDWGPVLAAYLATMLLGAAYISAGLLVSAHTDNPIVSLIGSIALCGLLYVLGSPILTQNFDDNIGEMLRMLGSGARFANISRGMVDARDLLYYASLIAVFLSLNVYALEKGRWAHGVATRRHRRWRLAIGLLLANIALLNGWVAGFSNWRVDLTEGRLYSISQPTFQYLDELQEPLLIRAYFSRKNHPSLAPLVPQLRDLIREYEIAGQGKVTVEFIDPALDPEVEKEANERFGIKASPFQVADRHQSALVNSYFNVLVQYGGEFQVLSFADLIEVKTASNAPAEVMLRNPEFDITRAIKEVVHSYQAGGDLFEGIAGEVEFIAYVSSDTLLPQVLLAYKEAITADLERAVAASKGKLSLRFVEPEAQDGRVARQINEQWAFKPMVTALDAEQEFFFYLTLANSQQVVQLPTSGFKADEFRLALDAGLKRFATGFTKTVALVVPKVDPKMARYKLGNPTFSLLEQAISQNYSIRIEGLDDGAVSPDADILAVIAPYQLSDRQLFAIDQFVMRGGTLILATSPYSAEISGGQMRMQDWDSGLDDWLAHHGISIGKQLVLDTQNAPFPAPVARQAGGFEFREVKLVDYPFFIDLRGPGLHADHPITHSLPQLTMPFASPISVVRDRDRRQTNLLRSSSQAWLADASNITPRSDSEFSSDGATRSHLTGVALQGRFNSWFSGKPHPLQDPSVSQGSEADPGIYSLIDRSPESARIVVYASNDFMDDQLLQAVAAGSGTQYRGALDLFINTLDWSLQDEKLLQIRSKGHFNRTLPPMERRAQLAIEYFNYALAIAYLILLAIIHALRKWWRRRYYTRGLAA